MTETAEHLGGYVEGGDDATYFPDLWRWAVEKFDVKTVLDVGCGEGHAVRAFKELGCDAWGIDGVPNDYTVHDYTTGPRESDMHDLVWCCEFVEHIEERFLPNVIPSFLCGRYVMMTHAFPGQLGHHHVNCREPEYWKGFMAGIGFEFLEGETALARLQAAINPSPWNHFCRAGLVFSRRS